MLFQDNIFVFTFETEGTEERREEGRKPEHVSDHSRTYNKNMQTGLVLEMSRFKLLNF